MLSRERGLKVERGVSLLMRKQLMDILACPLCKGELSLNAVSIDGEEIVEGTLTCPSCEEEFPIEEGIPNLLPPEMRAV